jgi:hypothetical protein
MLKPVGQRRHRTVVGSAMSDPTEKRDWIFFLKGAARGDGEHAFYDWPLADQLWRDWRAANASRFDAQGNDLLEQAWAAGLVDGAATITTGYSDDELRIKMEVTQSQGDQGRINLMRFQRAVGGTGTISGPYSQAAQSNYHLWQANSESEVERVWKVVGPFLGLAKFVQFRRAMTALSPAPHRPRNGAPRAEARNGKLNAKGKAVRRRAH